MALRSIVVTPKIGAAVEKHIALCEWCMPRMIQALQERGVEVTGDLEAA